MRQALIAFPLAAWLLFAALAASFFGSNESCGDDGAFWTTWWFFAPPVLAAPGLAAAAPARAGSILASIALIAAWSVFLVVWFFSAVACGA